MVTSECLLTNFQRVLIQRECFRRLLLHLVATGHLVQRFCDVRMLQTQGLLAKRKGALVKRFRLLVLALFSKEVRQSIEGLGKLVVV